MRFELAPGDLVLVEVSHRHASRSSIKVAFARAQAEAARLQRLGFL